MVNESLETSDRVVLSDLVMAIRLMPSTWLPSILLLVVEVSEEKKVFPPGMLQKAVHEKLIFLQKEVPNIRTNR